MEDIKRFLPTTPAKLRANEPKDVHEMIMFFVNRYDQGLEGFERPVNAYQPAIMAKVVEANKKKDAQKRNWFGANVHKFAL